MTAELFIEILDSLGDFVTGQNVQEYFDDLLKVGLQFTWKFMECNEVLEYLHLHEISHVTRQNFT